MCLLSFVSRKVSHLLIFTGLLLVSMGAADALAQCAIQPLTDQNGISRRNFGMALSIDGDWAVVSGLGSTEDGTNYVLADIFYRTQPEGTTDSADIWVPQSQIAVETRIWNSFSGAVSLSGNRLLLGASVDSGLETRLGAAYVFRRDDNATPLDVMDDSWIQEAKLIPSDSAFEDIFGWSVSLNGKRAVVGAWGIENNGTSSGAVYVFRLDDNFTPADASDDTWVEQAKLVASDSAPRSYFGASVSLDGNRVLVGSPGGGFGDRTGTAYVYKINDNGTPADPNDDTWIEETKLLATETIDSDFFGWSVSLSGKRALIGAYGLNDGTDFEGSAFIFDLDDAGTPLDLVDDTWIETARLTASDGVARDEFGFHVALSGDSAIIGALQADGFEGAAYLFKNVAGVWTEMNKLKGSESDTNVFFGWRVAVDGDSALMGHARDNKLPLMFRVDGADADGDGTLDACCLSATPIKPESSVATNRYISFSADKALSLQAARVVFFGLPVPFDVLDGQTMWVGPPQEISENSGRTDSTGPTTTIAALQCDPYYTDWSAWGAIHVTHENIIPGSNYTIQLINDGCGAETASNFSMPFTTSTASFGDVVRDCSLSPCAPPDGSIDMVDAVAILDKFRNLSGAVIKIRADLEPGTPDFIINMADVVLVLIGFQSKPYPFQPSGVICP